MCGVVRDAQGKLLVLPNMLGHFGPPTPIGYRGDGGSRNIPAD